VLSLVAWWQTSKSTGLWTLTVTDSSPTRQQWSCFLLHSALSPTHKNWEKVGSSKGILCFHSCWT